jgi:adenylate cyclase
LDPDGPRSDSDFGAIRREGTEFCGRSESEQSLFDFTALGDTVNVAARLGSDAGPGELLVTGTAWRAAGNGESGDWRRLTVKGRDAPLEVVVVQAASPEMVVSG